MQQELKATNAAKSLLENEINELKAAGLSPKSATMPVADMPSI